MAQITARLTPEEHRAFVVYAAEFGLDASGLAHLLFIRELRLDRLRTLAAQSDGGETALMKVTAHTGDANLKSRLQSRAQENGLSLSRGCALLLRAELSERWLERAVNHRDSK